VQKQNVISDYAKTKYPLVFVHGMFGLTVWVQQIWARLLASNIT
jgi:hypothetical protein